jgi:hypothetical protein
MVYGEPSKKYIISFFCNLFSNYKDNELKGSWCLLYYIQPVLADFILFSFMITLVAERLIFFNYQLFERFYLLIIIQRFVF